MSVTMSSLLSQGSTFTLHAGDSPKLPEYSPDLHYKMCKKIAQLTKVVYTLSVKTEDMEAENRMLRRSSEDSKDSFLKEVDELQAKNKNQEEELVKLGLLLVENDEKRSRQDETIAKLSARASALVKERDICYEENDSLQTSLQTLNELCGTLKGQSEKSNKEIEEWKKLVEDISTGKDKEAKLNESKLQEQCSFLESKICELENERNALRLEIEQLKENTSRTIKELTEERNSLQTKVEESVNSSQALEKKLKIAQEECDDIQRKLEKIRDERESHDRMQGERFAVLREELRAEFGTAVIQARQEEKLRQMSEEKCELLKELEKTAEERRNLLAQEARFKERLQELTTQLGAKEAEMETLRADLETSRTGLEKYQTMVVDANGLRDELLNLRRELDNNKSVVRNAALELDSMKRERDGAVVKVSSLEEELSSIKQKNMELAAQLLKKSDEMLSIENNNGESEKRVKELETRLREVEQERDKLLKEREEIEAEREEELKIIQEALEEALEEKQAAVEKFEREFETLRTVNSDREQQLLDDFEWKLREVEQACKKRLEEKDKVAQEKLKDAEKQVKEAAQEKKLAEDEMKQASHLKSFEAEVTQLRGVTHEQQRSLRVSARQVETMRATERSLQDEIDHLKAQVEKERAQIVLLQASHQKQLTEKEKETMSRLEKLRNDLNVQLEDRLRQECSRLKMELDQLHLDEKKVEAETAAMQFDNRIRSLNESFELRTQELVKEVEGLQQCLANREAELQHEIQMVQSAADRTVCELRREINRIEMNYDNQIEKMKEEHEAEIERLQEETEKTYQEIEDQIGERLKQKHAAESQQIAAQWESLLADKEETIVKLEEGHRRKLQELEAKVQQYQQISGSLEELQARLNSRENEVTVLQQGVHTLNEQVVLERQNTADTIKGIEAGSAACLHQQVSALRDLHERQMATTLENHREEVAAITSQLEEAYARLEGRESLPEDAAKIQELKSRLIESQKQLQEAIEQRNYYHLELLNREQTYSQMFKKGGGPLDVVGVVDPLKYHDVRQRRNSLPGLRMRAASSYQHQTAARKRANSISDPHRSS